MGSIRSANPLALAAIVLLTAGDGRYSLNCFAEDLAGQERADEIRSSFELVKQDFEQVAKEVDNLVRVDFQLEHQLLRVDEEVELQITATSEKLPNSTLHVLENCYAASPKRLAFELDWKPGPTAGKYQATWNWLPPGTGNYYLSWECDCGGDVPVFSRNFSVVDGSYAVVILNSTSHTQPRPEPDFHELRLPFSYWSENFLFARRPIAEQFVQISRNARQYGDDAGLMIFLGGDYYPDSKAVFYDEPEAVQRTILQSYQEFWEMARFPQPLTSLYTYGMGNGPVSVGRELGINLLGALCASQNWGDGPFKINHWGMPTRPYFVSRDDFRRPTRGSAEAMVGIQQCMRHSMGCRDYNCVYSFESGIAYAFDKYTGKSGERFSPEVILSREKAFFDCFLDGAKQSDEPYFFSCGFEMNGVWPHMAAINRQMMEYFVDRANDSPIAYTNAAAAADFYRRHYQQTPEALLYLPDVFAGMRQGGKPANYPDTIEIENHEFRALFRSGETLPHAQYDYTVEWDYEDWGNLDIPRKPDGYVVPDTEDRFQITPKIVDTRSIDVEQETQSTPTGSKISLVIESKEKFRNMVLALWDLPHAYTSDSGDFRLEGAARFVPVNAPFR